MQETNSRNNYRISEKSDGFAEAEIVCCYGCSLGGFDLQNVVVAAVLWVNVAVAAILGVDFTLSRRSLGGGVDSLRRNWRSSARIFYTTSDELPGRNTLEF